MSNKSDLYQASPSFLIRHPSFWWINHKIFIAILGLNIVVAILLFDQTFPRFDDPLILVSICIYLFALWGVLIVAQSLCKFSIEIALAKRINKRCLSDLSLIRAKQVDRILLSKVEQFIPSPSKDFTSVMVRLSTHIIEDAKDRKFDSAEIVMSQYKEELLNDSIQVNTLQKLALRLGILGTFIGLILAFRFISTESPEESFKSISNALTFSFSTSISGLEASILLSLLSIYLNRKRELFVKEMEDATQVLLALSRNSINKDFFLAGFDQLKNSMEEVRKSIIDQQGETKVQTLTIESGLHKLQETKHNFDKFLIKLTDEVKSVYQILSPEQIGLELKESLKVATEGISDFLNNELLENLESHTQISQVLNNLTNNLELIEQNINLQTQSNTQQSQELYSNIHENILEFSTLQKNYLTQISGENINLQFQNNFGELTTKLSTEISGDLTTIAEYISRLEKTLNSYQGIIDKKVPKASKLPVIVISIISVISIGLLSTLIIQKFAPEYLDAVIGIVKKVIGRK